MNKELKKWEKYFSDSGIDQNLTTKYIRYISPLLGKGIPIIFGFKHLSQLLGRTPNFLGYIIYDRYAQYRTFEIPKKRGGTRTINVPYPSLLESQYWILQNILQKTTVHPTANGFVKNKSIITNAKIHLGQKEILKIDIKDFYPSIKINKIISFFKELGYTNKIAFYLASIVTLDDALPQGAPTSPYISNIISRNLDKRLLGLSKKFDLKYSRYADDMVISGERIPARIIQYVYDIIRYEDFEPNLEKTILSKAGQNKIVTGISINSGKLRIPRSYKRKIKQEIHFIMKYGYFSHVWKKQIKNPYYIDSLIGKIQFWLSVEPTDKKAIEIMNSMKALRLQILGK